MRPLIAIAAVAMTVVLVPGCVTRETPTRQTREPERAVQSPARTVEASAANESTSRPFPVSQSATPQGKAVAVVAATGEPLTRVTIIPPETIGPLPLPEGVVTAEFDAIVEPYGFERAGGPASGRRRAFVRIVKAKPLDAGARQVRDLNGMNAVLTLPSRPGDGFTQGGRYRIVLMVRPVRGLGALFAEKVEPAS